MKKRIYSLLVTASMFFSILPVEAALINPDDLATDGKLVENVARYKNAYRAKSGSSLSGWTNGVENDDPQFTDTNWLQGYGSGEYGIVDLEKAYSIAAIGIMSTEMPWHHAPTEIYGTNDPSCSLNGAELIATITLEDAQNAEIINGAVKKSVVAANGGKYRYILFKPVDANGDGLIVKEVFVYSYLTDEYGQWNITDNSGIRSFTLPVTYVNPSEAKEFTIDIVNYDEEGYMTKYTQAEAEGSPLSAQTDITQNNVKSQAVLLSGGKPVSDAPLGIFGFDGFNADKGKADSFETAVSDYAGDNYLLVEGKTVASSDTIIVKAVKSDAETAEDAFNDVQSLYWYGAAKSDNGYSFKIPFSEGGQYYIEVTRYDKDGASESKYFKYNMIDTALRQDCIDSFMSFESDGENNLSEYITDAVDNLGFITESSLINRSSTLTSEFAQTFTDVRDIMADSDVDSDELIKMLNTATVVYFLKKGDNSYMTEYGYLIEGEVKDYVESELGYSFDADVKAEFSLSEPVTNIGTEGRLIFSFSGAQMDASTLTSENITLEKNGKTVEYEILSADSSSISIDKSVLEQGGKYKISFNGGCLTTDGKRMTEVKSFEFTAGEIIDIPYKEGKIIKNVALNKSVTGAVDTSYREEPANVITDGNTSKDVLFKVNETIVIDLEDYYEICALNFSGDDPAMGRWYHNTGVAVLGSDTSPKFKDDYTTLFRFSESTSEVATQVDCLHKLEGSDKVRYIGLRRNSEAGILMREIKAYAYVDTEFGPWETKAFNGAGNYTFAIAVTENVDSNSYYMLINAYDENSNTVKASVNEVTAKNGKLSATINAPSACRGISAVVVSDIETMRAVTDSVTIGEAIETQPSVSEGISVVGSDSGLTIDVAPSEKMKNSSRVVVSVVKTAETGKTAKEAFENMSASQLEANTVYSYMGKCSDGIQLFLDSLAEGKYYINTSVSNLDGSVENVYYKYTVVSDEVREDIVSDFMSADESGVIQVISDALNVSEVISTDALADTSYIDQADFSKLVVYTRDLIYTESEKAQSKSITDVIDAINAASFVKALYDSDSEKAKELSVKYAPLLGEYFDNKVDIEKFTAVFSEIKENINSAQTLGETLEWAKMLSYMKNASNSDVAQAMRTYKSELGIDLNYASEKKVSLERTAEFMDFTNLKALVGKTAFNNAYKSAVKEASSYGGGGGGGGSSSRPVSGGGGSIGIAPSSKTNANSGNNQSSTTVSTDNDAVFADMAEYSWANDAVKSLKEKGIVNGTETGNFEPARFVTRAEFIKMLVMAADIRVDESVYMSFIDVPDGSWYYPYIKIAFSKNICSGVSDYYFNPEGNITRQDMAVLADNLMKAVGVSASGEAVEFTDYASVADYAQKAVNSAAKSGIINGFDDSSFRPLENTRRVDAAMVIYKLTEMIK